jgi:hypothetical protein
VYFDIQIPEYIPSEKFCLESNHDPAGSIQPENFSTGDWNFVLRCPRYPGKNQMVVIAPGWVQDFFQKYVAWKNY